MTGLRRALARLRRLRALRARGPSHPVIRNAGGVDEAVADRRALLVYLPEALLLAEDDPELLRHQSRKRCRYMAAVLADLGYVVDVVHKKDERFAPIREYDLVIGVNHDWRGPGRLRHPRAIRVFLATTMNHLTHNANIRRRHRRLAERRGCELRIRRRYGEHMPVVEGAHAIVGVGNDFTMSTWRDVFDGPIHVFDNFGFDETPYRPEAKDFERTRRNFLFFASGGQVQKGLDLLLDLFPALPGLRLYVCSSFEKEHDFLACYRRELYETPNIFPVGWTGVHTAMFSDLVDTCAYVINPTCSEGQAGAVVQCMHAGLIPLVTREAGLDTEDFGVTFAGDSLDELERAILAVSELPPEWHRERSMRTRRVAEARYSEAAFRRRWAEIVTELEALRSPKRKTAVPV